LLPYIFAARFAHFASLPLLAFTLSPFAFIFDISRRDE